MARAEVLKPFILSWEGGFVNHPNDKGKATMKGITIGTFRNVYGQGKSVQDLKNMTDHQWQYIFEKKFWNEWKANDIQSQSIANLLVDWVWGSGPWGIIFPQRILGVHDDGKVGSITLAALNAQEPSALFAKLWKRRKEHFEACAAKPGQSVFLKGWMNRLNGIKYDRLVLNGGKIITWTPDSNAFKPTTTKK